jgi:hypothetical protein
MTSSRPGSLTDGEALTGFASGIGFADELAELDVPEAGAAFFKE